LAEVEHSWKQKNTTYGLTITLMYLIQLLIMVSRLLLQ